LPHKPFLRSFCRPFTVGLLRFPLEMTGLLHDAEVGFAWITFKSSKSFFIVWAYYSGVVFVGHTLNTVFSKKRQPLKD
jgi:hypothetical protein